MKMTLFIRDAWKHDPCIASREDISELTHYLQNSSLERVEEFWDPRSLDNLYKTWKPKEWWQDLAPNENIEKLYYELCTRKIPKNAGPDKLRWGYTNVGNFNIKEEIGLLTETHTLEKDGKWIKIWGGRWWPKVAAFDFLLLRRRILTWDNIQICELI